MKFVLAWFSSHLAGCKQLVSVSLILHVQFGCVFLVSNYASYAWFNNCTCNHAPLGELQFFSLLGVYSPPPDTQKETIPHPRAPDRPHIRFLLHLFYPCKSKTTRFQIFYERFPEFIERRIMDIIM